MLYTGLIVALAATTIAAPVSEMNEALSGLVVREAGAIQHLEARERVKTAIAPSTDLSNSQLPPAIQAQISVSLAQLFQQLGITSGLTKRGPVPAAEIRAQIVASINDALADADVGARLSKRDPISITLQAQILSRIQAQIGSILNQFRGFTTSGSTSNSNSGGVLGSSTSTNTGVVGNGITGSGILGGNLLGGKVVGGDTINLRRREANNVANISANIQLSLIETLKHILGNLNNRLPSIVIPSISLPKASAAVAVSVGAGAAVSVPPVPAPSVAAPAVSAAPSVRPGTGGIGADVKASIGGIGADVSVGIGGTPASVVINVPSVIPAPSRATPAPALVSANVGVDLDKIGADINGLIKSVAPGLALPSLSIPSLPKISVGAYVGANAGLLRGLGF